MPPKKRSEPFSPDTALRRLFYLAGAGWLVILAYAGRIAGPDFLAVAAVGLMAGGAALLSGGLLGFLFGVPYTRETTPVPSDAAADKGGTVKRQDVAQATEYRPNTSLEQVSDWLTKIIVGIGLVQFRDILAKLIETAVYIANGLGGGRQAETFAATILIYFATCGFVFGFLWARLYLKKWFSEADTLKDLTEKVSRLEVQQEADGKALALAIRLLNRSSFDPPLDEVEVADAITAASPAVRAQIFGQTSDVSANRQASDYASKLEGVLSIIRGLIASDKKSRYHQNHAELAYALRRKEPSDLEGAIKAMSRAIEIRDATSKKGWRYYEFFRARTRIEIERGANPSQKAVVDQVLADLKAAKLDLDKWPKWIATNPVVESWAKANQINLASL